MQRLALPAGGLDEMKPLWWNWLKPRKLLENAQAPTSRMHAVLAGIFLLAMPHPRIRADTYFTENIIKNNIQLC